MGNYLDLMDNGDGSFDVMFNSDADIGGFQFEIDGATVLSGDGGAAADAGFTVSAGGSTVLRFSFTGGSIPSCEGVLTTLTITGEPMGISGIVMSDPSGNQIDGFCFYPDCENEPMLGCTDMNACNYNPSATEDDGSCVSAEFDCWDGSLACDESDCPAQEYVVELSIDNVNAENQTFDVVMTNSIGVAGYQFDLTGAMVESVEEGSGLADAAGFTTSTSETTILGFSFSGSVIEPQEGGALLTVNYLSLIHI